MSRHIVLIGLPGAGKTTVGRALAARLGTRFADIDAEIEASEGNTVAGLFASRGEAAFRILERDAVLRALRRDPHVLGPGGGWIAQPGAIDESRAAGAWLVYLKVRPEVAAERVGPDTSRPLLAGLGNTTARLRELLDAREAAYAAADLVVNGAASIDALVDDLASAAIERAGWPPSPDSAAGDTMQG